MISSLRGEASGLKVAQSPPPQACQGGAQYRMHGSVASTHANYQALAAALLTAYTSGARLQFIWFNNSGPCNETNALVLSSVEFEAQ